MVAANTGSEETSSRGIRLSHMMALVAVTAISIVATRSCLDEMRLSQHSFNHLGNWFVIASPSVMLLAVALLVISLLDVRRELFRRPGFAACWTTVLAMALRLSMLLISHVVHNRTTALELTSFFNYGFYWFFGMDMGGWIMVAWLTLALSGTWTVERSWIDRLGRAIGVFWILTDVANSFAWKLWLW